MFTILNIINYFTGKYVPTIILILITISVYTYVIYNWFDDLINLNIIYLVLLLLILLIDITSIIIIFSSERTTNHDSFIDDNKKILTNKKNIKKDKKKNKSLKNIKENLNLEKSSEKLNKLENNLINAGGNKIINNDILDKEIISLYDNDKEISLKTYNLI